MATTITSLTTETNVKEEMLQPTSLILEKSTSYEVVSNSASTTTTNSPVITSPHRSLELSSCPCNQLITSNYDCSDCGNTFDSIKEIDTTHKETKALLDKTTTQRDLLRHTSQENEAKCLQLSQELEEKKKAIETTIECIESLNKDLKVLKVKCQEESDQVQAIQESKEAVKRELEELSLKLFEEANAMIKIEKEQQDVIKSVNTQLELDLKSAQKTLKEASKELKLFRDKIEQHDQDESTGHIKHHSIIDEQPQQSQQDSNTSMEDNNIIDTYTRAQVEIILMHGLDLGIYMDTLEDDACLMDFNDFIQQLQKTPLRKLHSLKYFKYCVKEDIEPTLRFGPSPKLTAKKIMDAIMVKTCFIEESPYGFITEQDTLRRLKRQEETAAATASLWERFTSSTSSKDSDANIYWGCQACGRNTLEKEKRPELLKYRFRISYFDEWACIDRYCRDRLLSVVEFYMFIRHLRAGSYKHRSLHELYQQFIRLKLQMFISR